MRARTILVVAVAVLAVSAMPASAQNASVVASKHTTFGTGSAGEPSPTSLTNMTVEGSGESASVALESVVYNPVDDEGDGGTDPGSFDIAGDDSLDNAVKSELRIQPKKSLTITSIAPNIVASGSDYGPTIDVYIIQETPDGTYREGTKVATVDPDFTDGRQRFAINPYDVTAGQNYTIEFVTNSVSADGNSDSLGIRFDDSASSTWFSNNQAGARDAYPDLRVSGGGRSSGQFIGAPHNAEDITEAATDLRLDNASATVTWQEDADGDGIWSNVTSTTISSTQNLTQDLSGTTSDRWRVRVDIQKTAADAVAEVNDEGLLFEASSPTLSDPEPPDGVKIENATGDVSIDVSDGDFPLAQGDTVTVSATDDEGTSLGSTTLTSNGTASVSYTSEAGENVIEWTASDEYGNTETFTQTFTTPSTLKVRNESAPDQLVQTNTNITATFFGADGETVVERSSPDGTFDLSGLPADTEYVVTVSADGYRSRQVIITSLFEQQNIYLLPNNAPAAQVEFVLDDKTGEFPQDSSRLFVDIPIRVNNQTEFVTAFADEFGASGSLRVTLRDNTRYRVRVRNAAGDERVLGSYTVSGSDTVTLELGRLRFAVAGQPDTYNASATTVENDNGTVEAVKFNYNDPQELTTEINVSVQTQNGTTLGQDRATGTYGNYSFRQDINNSTAQNHTFVVVYELTRDGETIEGQLRPGLNRYPPGIPLDDGLKQLFSVGLLMVVGGLFSATNARVGAVVTPLFAAGLWYVEWLPPGTSMLAIALALGVGVLVNYGERK